MRPGFAQSRERSKGGCRDGSSGDRRPGRVTAGGAAAAGDDGGAAELRKIVWAVR